MLLKHFFVEKIAHSSYLLGGSNSCAIFDPQRDVDAKNVNSLHPMKDVSVLDVPNDILGVL